MFNVEDKSFSRDNCLYVFHLLREQLKKKGIDFGMQDVNLPEKSEFVLYIDMPKDMNVLNHTINYLVMMESYVIRPDDWNVKNHNYFRKIFTWHDELVDDKKYFKLYYPHKISDLVNFNHKKKGTLCTMIAGKKSCIESNKIYPYSAECFAETIVSGVGL